MPIVFAGGRRFGKTSGQIVSKEKEITAGIRSLLKAYNIWHFKLWQGLGSTPGIPDILGINLDGRFLAIEVKTERGTLSSAQRAVVDSINQHGGIAFVARSIDDVIDKLNLKSYDRVRRTWVVGAATGVAEKGTSPLDSDCPAPTEREGKE